MLKSVDVCVCVFWRIWIVRRGNTQENTHTHTNGRPSPPKRRLTGGLSIFNRVVQSWAEAKNLILGIHETCKSTSHVAEFYLKHRQQTIDEPKTAGNHDFPLTTNSCVPGDVSIYQ